MSNSTSIGLVDSFVKLNWNFQSQEAAGILIEIFIRYECFNTYPQAHVSRLASPDTTCMVHKMRHA